MSDNPTKFVSPSRHPYQIGVSPSSTSINLKETSSLWFTLSSYTCSPSRYVLVLRSCPPQVLMSLHPRSTGLRPEVEGQACRSGRCIPKGQGNARLARHAGSQGELHAPHQAYGLFANVPLTAGRNQVCHCRAIRARVFAAIPLEQPVLEDVRSLCDAPFGQAYGFDSMGGDVREAWYREPNGRNFKQQRFCICGRQLDLYTSRHSIPAQRGPLPEELSSSQQRSNNVDHNPDQASNAVFRCLVRHQPGSPSSPSA